MLPAPPRPLPFSVEPCGLLKASFAHFCNGKGTFWRHAWAVPWDCFHWALCLHSSQSFKERARRGEESRRDDTPHFILSDLWVHTLSHLIWNLLRNDQNVEHTVTDNITMSLISLTICFITEFYLKDLNLKIFRQILLVGMDLCCMIPNRPSSLELMSQHFSK